MSCGQKPACWRGAPYWPSPCVSASRRMQCSRVSVPLRADIGRVRAAVDDDGIDGGNMSWIMEQQQSLQANAEKEVLEEELAASGTCLRAGGRLCVCVCVCVCVHSVVVVVVMLVVVAAYLSIPARPSSVHLPLAWACCFVASLGPERFLRCDSVPSRSHAYNERVSFHGVLQSV
jgi:hypothetical protein